MRKITVFDIINLTPKNNCGKCGYTTCMAFAVALLTGRVNARSCPFIKLDELKDIGIDLNGIKGSHVDPDTALLKELKSKILNINLEKKAKDLGAEIIKEDGQIRLRLFYLGKKVIISNKSIIREDSKELDPRDQILLYNYVYFGGSGELSGEWVGLESFPNSISKVNTIKRYTEDKLAQHFGEDVEELYKRSISLMAKKIKNCHADLCLQIPVLPKIPIQLHFWKSEPEEGFAAQAKVLFDKYAINFLDLESLVFTAERMAEELIG